MKIVLLHDVPGTGKRGEAREIAEGYYLNYLAPKGLAVAPDDNRAKAVVSNIEKLGLAKQAEIDKVSLLASSIDGKTIELNAKASNNKLFGAIHEAEVARALNIDVGLIKMEPIKTVGEHKVELRLPHGQKANINVRVVSF